MNTQVLSVCIRGSNPVDIKMTPVLKILMELNARASQVFPLRVQFVAGLAKALNISYTLIRFAAAENGSLEGSSFISIDIEPTHFPCSIPEAALLTYCPGHRRLGYAYPSKCGCEHVCNRIYFATSVSLFRAKCVL